MRATARRTVTRVFRGGFIRAGRRCTIPESRQAAGPRGRALHPAHGGLRADGTVPAGHDVRGRVGAVPGTLVPVLRHGGHAGRRCGLGPEAAPAVKTLATVVARG